MKEHIDLDSIYKALASPIRRAMLNWLRYPEVHFADQQLPVELGVCAMPIARRCGLAQSTVSVHLAILSSAGLVISKKISNFVCFRRNEATLQAFIEQMQASL